MRFVNVTGNRVRFELGGVEYACLPGSCVDIPDRVAYAVALCGIQLQPAPTAPPADPEPPPPPAAYESKPTAPPADPEPPPPPSVQAPAKGKKSR